MSHTCEEQSLHCQSFYCSAIKKFSLLHSSAFSSFHQQWIQLRNIQYSIMWFSFLLIVALLLNTRRLCFCSVEFTIFIFATAICSLYLHVRKIKQCLIQLVLITSVKPKIISSWQEWIPWGMPRNDFFFSNSGSVDLIRVTSNSAWLVAKNSWSEVYWKVRCWFEPACKRKTKQSHIYYSKVFVVVGD